MNDTALIPTLVFVVVTMGITIVLLYRMVRKNERLLQNRADRLKKEMDRLDSRTNKLIGGEQENEKGL